jgi:hypothetical protein
MHKPMPVNYVALNEEFGIRAIVMPYRNGFRVLVHDTDADMTLPDGPFFHTEGAAIDYAQRCVEAK